MRLSFATMWLMVIAISLCSAAHAQSKDLWDVRMQTSAPGMPAGSMPANTFRSCVARDENPVRMMSQQPGCVAAEQAKTAEGWRWKITCEGGVTGTGRIKFVGTDAYEGESQMTVQGQTFDSKITGKRVGKC